MNIRTLTASEVAFEVKVEEEDTPVKGAFATDDEALDAQQEREILDRLRRGDCYAWCCIVVSARWKEYRGYDSLGACSLSGESEVESTVTEHNMRESALENLNTAIAQGLEELNELLT